MINTVVKKDARRLQLDRQTHRENIIPEIVQICFLLDMRAIADPADDIPA
jgi:hypothetical protein